MGLHLTLISAPRRLAKSDSSVCKLSVLFRPAARAPRESLLGILPERTLWKGSNQKKLVEEKDSVVASGSVFSTE